MPIILTFRQSIENCPGFNIAVDHRFEQELSKKSFFTDNEERYT
jgi:hypothetical protein